MKITFDDVLNQYQKDLFHSCFMNNLTTEMIQKGIENNHTHEVKLIINGIESEFNIIKKIFDDIDKYIELEADKLVALKFSQLIGEERFYDLKQKLDKIEELFDDVAHDTRSKFNIYDYEDD